MKIVIVPNTCDKCKCKGKKCKHSFTSYKVLSCEDKYLDYHFSATVTCPTDNCKIQGRCRKNPYINYCHC
jgi:hypothetical protein